MKPPCQSVCTKAVLYCQAVFTALGMASLLPNCSVTSTFPPDTNVANPTYCNRPNNSISMSTPTTITTTTTSPPQITLLIILWWLLVVPYNQADCPYPLKYNRDGEADFAESNYDLNEICLYPCPDPMWTEGEWIGNELVMSTLVAAYRQLILFFPDIRRYCFDDGTVRSFCSHECSCGTYCPPDSCTPSTIMLTFATDSYFALNAKQTQVSWMAFSLDHNMLFHGTILILHNVGSGELKLLTYYFSTRCHHIRSTLQYCSSLLWLEATQN